VTDGRYHTLKKADQVEVESERSRYFDTADTLQKAIDKLTKMVDGAADANAGKWLEGLKDDASSIKDNLVKAHVRYADAARYIHDYQPELEKADKDADAAVRDQEAGADALKTANGLPDGQKGSDGTLSPDEQAKDKYKQGQVETANDQVNDAKNRLTAVLDALGVAGKTLGDKVNCNNYDDGLTDSTKDKILEAFQWISYIFGKIALVLTVLAFLIPGLQVLAIGALVAGAVLLISDSVLFANGMAKWSDVFLDALGLGFGALGAAFTKIAKGLGSLGKMFGGPKNIPANGIVDLTEGGTMIFVPKPGFWAGESTALWNTMNTWKNFFTNGPLKWNFGALGKGYLQNILDTGTLAELIEAGFNYTKSWWIWGLANTFLNLGAGIGYAGYQINQGGGSPTV
jgi:hypothetical protein